MAGYSKGIVDTRKLNKNSKAKLGRRGDTEIREVDNRESHVNAFEAYLIDVYGKAGEKFTKEVGSGTRNPLTGLKEYDFGNWDHNSEHMQSGIAGTPGPHEIAKTGSDSMSLGMIEEGAEMEKAMWGEKKTYSEIQAMDPTERTQYLKTFGLEGEDMGLISEFEQEPFTFLGEEKTTALGGVALREKGIGLGESALSRSTGRGLREFGKGRDIAASRSGLATSGTITQAYESQKKDLFQDYRAGTKAAGLDFRQAEYAEKQRQEDQYYDDLVMISGMI